ncbi:hypothetical protein KHQ81_01550 [Mycoplasmatota bacterium]|nr:hypothetical protein KHQ81_01550 [Mycoplasmatota bacterium]
MSKISIKEYIKEHRQELEQNPNVLKVGKILQYTPKFKIKAVEMRKQGYPMREIFEIINDNIKITNLDYEKVTNFGNNIIN